MTDDDTEPTATLELSRQAALDLADALMRVSFGASLRAGQRACVTRFCEQLVQTIAEMPEPEPVPEEPPDDGCPL
ncbi:MAG: hypothetical protein V3U45_04215 [bacterium]